MSIHRYHHQYVDTPTDPHSPIKGFWFSHLTWYLQKSDQNVNEMIPRHRKWENVTDLKKQTFYRFLHKTYLLHPIALAAILYSIGGAPFFIWGMVTKKTPLSSFVYFLLSYDFICYDNSINNFTK